MFFERFETAQKRRFGYLARTHTANLSAAGWVAIVFAYHTACSELKVALLVKFDRTKRLPWRLAVLCRDAEDEMREEFRKVVPPLSSSLLSPLNESFLLSLS